MRLHFLLVTAGAAIDGNELALFDIELFRLIHHPLVVTVTTHRSRAFFFRTFTGPLEFKYGHPVPFISVGRHLSVSLRWALAGIAVRALEQGSLQGGIPGRQALAPCSGAYLCRELLLGLPDLAQLRLPLP
jgi:hypothetical protein